MTQTVNGQKKTPKNTTQKQGRPGQRQQERLERLERRLRRRRIWTSVLVAVVVVALAGLSFWQYQRFTTQQSIAAAQKTATATQKQSTASAAQKTANPTHVGPNCSTATSNVPVYDSTPKAGPTNPPSVTGTPAHNSDGLQCLDIKVGTGAVAQLGGTVSVEYTGWLASNGKKFDSSYDRGAQPFSVTPLGQAQIIPGWNEGLVGMKAGGIRRLIIPAALAYGAQGSPPQIPANATLIFDVTVLSVQ
jgi:FKBP-type peptidyl-prolyl cis-trans isomerase